MKKQLIAQNELLTLSERNRIKRIILREWTPRGDCIEHLNFYSINGKDFETDMENSQMRYHSPRIDFDIERPYEEQFDEELKKEREFWYPNKKQLVQTLKEYHNG